MYKLHSVSYRSLRGLSCVHSQPHHSPSLPPPPSPYTRPSSAVSQTGQPGLPSLSCLRNTHFTRSSSSITSSMKLSFDIFSSVELIPLFFMDPLCIVHLSFRAFMSPYLWTHTCTSTQLQVPWRQGPFLYSQQQCLSQIEGAQGLCGWKDGRKEGRGRAREKEDGRKEGIVLH